MKRKHHKKRDSGKIAIIALIIVILASACFILAPREVVLKDARFGEPGSEKELYFTIVNNNFFKKDCTLFFSIDADGNQTMDSYDQEIGARQKIARNITFEMPAGESKMNLNISCR